MGASSSLLEGVEISTIRLIPFERFKSLGTTPRFPDNKDLTITIDQLTEEEYNNSLIIFISHCWLRGWSGAEGWDGRPHPDNSIASKYELCVKGIDLIREKMTDNMTGCYVWMDYGCIDQDGDPAGELKQLDKIIQICDLIFTPIYDADWQNRQWPPSYIDYYKDYISPHWTGTPFSYVNRGWCRIEMFYAANIPVHPDNEDRAKKFKNGLAFHRKAGRRPHLLYGSQEKDGLTVFPIMLPPLQNAYFERYHPAEGELSHPSDHHKIIQLVDELKPYMERVKVGYEGSQ